MAVLMVAFMAVAFVSCGEEPKPAADTEVEKDVQPEVEAEPDVEAEAEVKAEPEVSLDDLSVEDFANILNAQGLETGVEGMTASFAAEGDRLVILFTLNEELAAAVTDEVLTVLVDTFSPMAQTIKESAPVIAGVTLEFYTEAGEFIDGVEF